MQRNLKFFSCGLVLGLVLSAERLAQACFCCFGGPPPTLSGQLFEADGAFLARLVSKAEFVVKNDDGDEYPAHTTTFELIETLKPGLADVAPRMHVTLDYEYDGSPGDLAVLFGSILENDEESEAADEESAVVSLADDQSEPEINWEATERLTWAGYEYIRRLPREDLATSGGLPSDRLAYFVPFLEHPDAVVSNDAFEEIDRADFADLIPLADRLPREKLAKWVANSEDAWLFRRRMYAILLGLCGNRDDAELLRRIALTVPSPDDENSIELIGVEGAMIGYLMLTGERGLDEVAVTVLANQTAPAESVSHTLDAIQFLAFASPESISAAKLRAAVRRALDRQDSAGSAIRYLSLLSDWESQDKIISLLDACGYEDDEIRYAIAEYLQSSAAHFANPELRASAEKAESVLADLRRRDPQLLEDADVTTINW